MERIGLIGAGRAGTALGAALAAAGHRLVGVTARSSASRERAARLLPRVPVLTADEVTVSDEAPEAEAAETEADTADDTVDEPEAGAEEATDVEADADADAETDDKDNA